MFAFTSDQAFPFLSEWNNSLALTWRFHGFIQSLQNVRSDKHLRVLLVLSFSVSDSKRCLLFNQWLKKVFSQRSEDGIKIPSLWLFRMVFVPVEVGHEIGIGLHPREDFWNSQLWISWNIYLICFISLEKLLLSCQEVSDEAHREFLLRWQQEATCNLKIKDLHWNLRNFIQSSFDRTLSFS